MPPVSNVLVSLSELIDEYAAGSDLRMFFMLWFEKPISPRRYQPPKSAGGGGAYIGGAGRSAAKATDDNSDAAPAATRNLTLRIGFVPYPVRQTKGAPHPKIDGTTMPLNA